MKTVKIKFVDMPKHIDAGSLGEVNRIEQIFVRALEKYYRVELSEQPDYIFCFLPIPGCDGVEYAKYPNAVRIQVAQESVRPEFNVFDYCIGMFPDIKCDRYFYLPSSLLCNESVRSSYEQMRIKHLNIDLQKACARDFCSFVVSNANGAPERGEFLEVANSYKRVDSGGGYRNNIGYRVQNKIEFEAKHKFSIAFENCYYSCVTEKINMSFAAKTVPIYWGNPDVGKMYNEKAFVNCHNFDDFEAVLDYVKKIDNDDSLYKNMLKEPALLVDKSLKEYEDDLSFFLKNIIEQPKKNAIIRTSVEWSGYMERIRYYGMKRHMRVMGFTFWLGTHTPKWMKKCHLGSIVKNTLFRKM